jgi:plastocyanin
MVNSLILLIPILAAGASTGAEEEVRKLRREVETMRTELSALRFVLSEIARSNRLQADLVDRTMGGEDVPDAPAQPAAEARPISRKQPKERPIASRRAPKKDAPQGTVSGSVKVPEGEAVAYVYVENVVGRLTTGKRVEMDQVSKQFAPRWAVIEKGTEVAFPNGDNIYHNVFSRSPGNNFDLGMYRKGEAKSHRFIKAGPVDVFCNIHPRMAASILVVPNRHFAKVQADGSFVIPNVPAGRRKIVARAPGAEIASAWVDLEENGTSSVKLELSAKSPAHPNKQGRPYGSYQ